MSYKLIFNHTTLRHITKEHWLINEWGLRSSCWECNHRHYLDCEKKRGFSKKKVISKTYDSWVTKITVKLEIKKIIFHTIQDKMLHRFYIITYKACFSGHLYYVFWISLGEIFHYAKAATVKFLCKSYREVRTISFILC